MFDPLEHELKRIDAAADLAMSLCPTCTVWRETLAADGLLPKAVGFRHEASCPEFLPDWP
jgi:hypothetical protein